MSNATKYQEAQKRIREALEEMMATAKAAFAEGTEALFAEHPTLVSFSWKQYTPYFNDGDECVFGARTGDMDFVFVGANGEKVEREDESKWSVKYHAEKEGREQNADDKAVIAAIDFMQAFDDNSLKEMFGDHQRVTCRRGECETESYEHD